MHAQTLRTNVIHDVSNLLRMFSFVFILFCCYFRCLFVVVGMMVRLGPVVDAEIKYMCDYTPTTDIATGKYLSVSMSRHRVIVLDLKVRLMPDVLENFFNIASLKI